jgi:hypothetical protein
MADDTPFDSIESAHEYVTLLAGQVEEVTASLAEDIDSATRDGAARHLDALRLVDFKLRQLSDHLGRSRRILNDLRALRRLLLTDREPMPTAMTAQGRGAPSIEAFEETTLMEVDSVIPVSLGASSHRTPPK